MTMTVDNSDLDWLFATDSSDSTDSSNDSDIENYLSRGKFTLYFYFVIKNVKCEHSNVVINVAYSKLKLQLDFTITFLLLSQLNFRKINKRFLITKLKLINASLVLESMIHIFISFYFRLA